MKIVTIRDFRTQSRHVRDALKREREAVLTAKTYEHRSDESSRSLLIDFVPTCGTTVAMTVETLPGTRGIAGGTFDDRSWLNIEWHTWLSHGSSCLLVLSNFQRAISSRRVSDVCC